MRIGRYRLVPVKRSPSAAAIAIAVGVFVVLAGLFYALKLIRSTLLAAPSPGVATTKATDKHASVVCDEQVMT